MPVVAVCGDLEGATSVDADGGIDGRRHAVDVESCLRETDDAVLRNEEAVPEPGFGLKPELNEPDLPPFQPETNPKSTRITN